MTTQFITFILSLFLICCQSKESFLHTLTISHPKKTFSSALIYIAQEKNFFSKEGLQIQLKDYATGIEAMVTNQADLAVTYQAGVIHHAFQGTDIKILTVLHQSTHNLGIVTLVKTGIQTPLNLKGKTIGVTKDTHAEFFLDEFLTLENLTISDIKLINLRPDQLVNALKTGKVDAISAWQPYIASAWKELGSHNTITFYSELYRELSFLVTRSNFLYSHKKAVTHLLKALAQAEDFIQTHPAESFQIIARQFKDIEPSELKLILAQIRFELGLSNHELILLEQESRWHLKKGFYKKKIPLFKNLLEINPLQQVEPSAVTVLDTED